MMRAVLVTFPWFSYQFLSYSQRSFRLTIALPFRLRPCWHRSEAEGGCGYRASQKTPVAQSAERYSRSLTSLICRA